MENEMEIFIEAAEQLQALKVTLAEQQGSSVRLRGLIDTLDRVATQIGKVPAGLSAIVEKADAVEQRILVAANQVQALRDGIPAVIKRIEQSDVGKSIDALTADISGSRSDLKAFHESISKIENVVQQFRNANSSVFEEITTKITKSEAAQEKVSSSVFALRAELLARLDGIEGRVVSTEAWSEKSISVTGKAYDVLATALKVSSDRQSIALQGFQSQVESLQTQELGNVRQELKKISAQLLQQGAVLEAVAKKKGFSF